MPEQVGYPEDRFSCDEVQNICLDHRCRVKMISDVFTLNGKRLRYKR